MKNIEYFLKAKSIAVVGASRDPEKYGNIIFKNMLNADFQGRLYPVNPKTKTILGVKCCPDLKQIEGDVELIIVVVPSRLVPQVLEEAGQKGVKAAIIISGGFSEIGEVELQNQILKIGNKYSLRLLGPNCQGVVYTPNNLCAYWPLVNAQGSMAIISQSGTIGAEFGIRAQKEHLGVSGIVSLGNKADANEIDFLNYFLNDPQTKSIALYTEGFSDSARFISLIKKAGRKKPLVILKPGRTQKGRAASLSHTGAISGSSEVFNGICRQYGIIRANNFLELYNYTKGLAYLKKTNHTNVLVVTSSGGSGVLAVDALVENDLNLAELSERTVTELREALPPICTIKNPVDLTGYASDKLYQQTIEIASADSQVNMFLIILGDPIPRISKTIIDLMNRCKQPLVICSLGGGELQQRENLKMQEEGIPVFNTPEESVKAISKIAQ